MSYPNEKIHSFETPNKIQLCFAVAPHEIDTERPFLEAFGWQQDEAAATAVVRACQFKGGWVPLTEQEVLRQRRSRRPRSFNLERLIERGFIVRWIDNTLRVTDEFIRLCFKAAPAISTI